jgi:hypothetical protein
MKTGEHIDGVVEQPEKQAIGETSQSCPPDVRQDDPK